MKTLSLSVLLIAAAAATHAQEIGWNYDYDGTITPSETAGVVAQTNWNDSFLQGFPSTASETDLQDSTGATTTLSFSPSQTGDVYAIHFTTPGQDANGTYNRNLLNGYLNDNVSQSITLTGIPYSQYNIIVYLSSDTAGRTGTVSVASTTYSFATVGPAETSGSNASFIQTTNTTGTHPSADYAVFTNLTGTSQTITTLIASYGGIAGFQVVSTGPTNVVNNVPPSLSTKFTSQTNWPLPQLNVASNALTPRMGWNSWFVVGNSPGPSEALVLGTADALVSNGLAAAGYKYLVIDCTWISSGNGSRDTNGNLIVNTNRWPDGMKYVADYVHSKGLYMGGYSDIGALGYDNQIGMYGYYQQDANQFAAWGWDFIKIDDHGPGDFFSAASAVFNNASGRPMVISLSTPHTDGIQFASRIANSFRVHDDISFTFGQVAWPGITTEFDTDQADWYSQAPGHWNDPDMDCTGLIGISDTEGRSHFNMWAILGAPLMIGTDVRTIITNGATSDAPLLTAATLNTLTNTEVIAVDQDPLGAIGTPPNANNNAIYAKPLGSFTSGQFAVLLLNRSLASNAFTVNWSDLGLVAGSSATVRDLWAHQNLGSFAGGFTSPMLAEHDSMMLIVTGTFDWNQPRTYEAESGYNTVGGVAYMVPHAPTFSATAYVTGVGSGTSNTLQFNNIAAPSNGLYEVDIYYACASNLTAQASVDGDPTTNISFPTTGGALQPAAIATYLQLNSGLNTITFGGQTNPAPNFDKLVVSQGVPGGLGAMGGDGQVQLAWTGPVGAVSFNVYRSTTSGGEGGTPVATGLTGPTYTDSTVTNGVVYYYTVTGVNPVLGGESPQSREASAEPRCATTSLAYQTAVLAANPVAYWRLNETNGTTAIDLLGAHNGTYGSAVELGVPGPRPANFLGFELTNTAAEFTNGVSNSWVTFPALNLNTSTLTITAWIYPVGLQTDYVGLVFCRSGTTVAGLTFGGAAFSTNAGNLAYTWNNDENTWGWNSGLTPLLDQWAFAALVVQPSSATLYLINSEGEQIATNVYANPTQAFAGTGTIGTDLYSTAGARNFNGLIDEVAIFNSALTPTQISQLYSNGAQLPQVALGFQSSGTSLNLSWPQGTLFQANNLNGPWTRVTNALSPYAVQTNAATSFFRVLLQQ